MVKERGDDGNVVLACGTNSGTVDLFNLMQSSNSSKSHLELRKSLTNLQTTVSDVTFHPNGELLAFSSKWTADALRMAHLSSGTVFANWPTRKTPLKKVNTVCFSGSGGYVAMGNDRGKVLLYRLEQYAQQ